MPHEAVDLAGSQFSLATGEPAEVLRGNLAQVFRVRFLYGGTSNRTTCGPGGLTKL
jgi:hypothetical protein